MFTRLFVLITIYLITLLIIATASKELALAIFAITILIGIIGIFGIWTLVIIPIMIATIILIKKIINKHNKEFRTPRDEFEKELIVKLKQEEQYKKMYEEIGAENQCGLIGKDKMNYEYTLKTIKKFKEELRQHREENSMKNN